jgi:hypothetical protein
MLKPTSPIPVTFIKNCASIKGSYTDISHIFPKTIHNLRTFSHDKLFGNSWEILGGQAFFFKGPFTASWSLGRC